MHTTIFYINHLYVMPLVSLITRTCSFNKRKKWLFE